MAENAAWDLAAGQMEYDLYAFESKSALSLSLAGALGMAGARVINPYRPDRFGDKIAATTVLAAAGVPLPRSWAVAGEGALRTLLAQLAQEGRRAALFLKPPRGSLGRGIQRVGSLADLDGERGERLRRAFVNRRGQPQALLAQEAFLSLDAPLHRIALPDIPTPYNVSLMNAVLPQVDAIAARMVELIEF